MKQISNGDYSGERALFKTFDAKIEKCFFHDGESPLKESKNLQINQCNFYWKYPLWYCDGVVCNDSLFDINARAGIWYTKNASFDRCRFEAPKLFRKCSNIKVSNTVFNHGEETFWWNDNIELNNIKVIGNYAFMKCSGIRGKNVEVEGGYAFDGCNDVELVDSKLITKDAFWNCKKIVCRNCYVECEYFGWNSEDVTLVNCTVKSHQGFCYMKNIKLVNCKLIETDLAFEYCKNISALVLSSIDSIKNPISGKIYCKSYGELIFDDPTIKKEKTEIKII